MTGALGERVSSSTVMNRLSLLRWQLDTAYSLLATHVRELTDRECLWEPAHGSWTVRRNADGHWVADWETAGRFPPRAPTIAWLTWYVGFWWTLVYSHSFGSGELRREHVHWPGTAAATATWLHICRNRWTRALESIDESELDSFARSRWFMRGTKPFGFVVAWTTTEVMRSAAEIGYVRSLYRTHLSSLAKGA